MKRFTATLSGFAIALTLTLSLTPAAHAADWSLNELSGGSFTLSEHIGQPVLLIYWATWCEPCKKELNEQRATFEGYAEQGVNVVLVSVDNQKTQSRVKPFIDSRGFKWPVLLDPGQETLKRYGGTSVPFTVLLDKSGEPQMKIRSGLKDPSALTARIHDLLTVK